MNRRVLLVCLFGLLETTTVLAQDSVDAVISLPRNYLRSIDKRTAGLDKQLTRQSEKYLSNLSRQEAKILRKLSKLDSSQAKEMLGDTKAAYEQLSQKLNAANGKLDKAFSGQYLPGLDSLQGALGFLKDAKNIVSQSKGIQQKLGSSLEQVKQLQNKLQQADEIKRYVQQRQEQLKTLLSSYTNLPRGITKHLGKYQQDIFYYGRQVQEYKETLNDPDKLFKKVLATLQTLPAFRKFMSRHSMLAGIFAPLPSAGTTAALDPTLPTRSQVMQMAQQRIAAGGQNGQQAFRQQLQQVQGEMAKLKDKFIEMGISPAGDMNMPNFKPNQQKTKTFLQRLEYGSSLQSQRAGNYFPVTTDIAATVGYKINDKSVVGIGISGKAGWGKNWKHIKITGEGVGMRFFVDWKARGNIWLTAGAELNYLKPVESLAVFKNYSNWNRSALAGISRKYKIGKKLKGNMQLLYDFMHRKHTPATDAFIWRVGYNF
ncbi:hypothetical protein [Agriterribacter sp.]|uniref:hypothetical protein n=1 Tax=Agriterribacter sp. TaxID=2821509 RepID=UPI002BDC7961|nr:hypothetical protein [Agriterribacter sp.]HTN06667.1 hypothetical protein [Agriterribacter sp.]